MIGCPSAIIIGINFFMLFVIEIILKFISHFIVSDWFHFGHSGSGGIDCEGAEDREPI